jgi:hypothetical protein
MAYDDIRYGDGFWIRQNYNNKFEEVVFDAKRNQVAQRE